MPGARQITRCSLPFPVAMLLVASFLIALAPDARAQAGGCTISTTPVAFGTYDTTSPSPLDSTGTIIWSCAVAGPIRIELSAGAAGTFAPRHLTQGQSTAAYNLYLDPARTIIWGDGTVGTQAYTGSGTGPTTVTVYGRVSALQTIAAGTYADSIVLTIVF